MNYTLVIVEIRSLPSPNLSLFWYRARLWLAIALDQQIKQAHLRHFIRREVSRSFGFLPAGAGRWPLLPR